jgi:hypothetical protein
MNLFCDAEFNGSLGGLISLALVSEDGTREFYEVVECHEPIDPWVVKNVLTVLNKDSISYSAFQASLKKFLSQFAGVNVIVNHPNDVIHFCKALIVTPKDWILIQPLTFELDDELSGKGSLILHNALADARATRESWFKKHGFS